MGFYGRVVYPHVQRFTSQFATTPAAMAIMQGQGQRATGSVLDIGTGGGGTLELVDPDRVTELYALDPHPGMIEQVERVAQNVPFAVKALCASAEEIPLEDESVDTVFSTFTFCTIPDLPQSLEEMRRVLRPGGQILFCEHGLSPDPRMAARQHRHEVWYHKRMYQGCYMTREIPQTIEAAGFEINVEYEGHLPLRLPRPWVYGWYGTARPPQ